MNKDCIFCKIAKNKIKVKKIYENNNFFVIPDVKPILQGHSLVISKKHFKTILDLPNSLGQEYLDAIKKASTFLMKKYRSEGFNLHINNFKSAGQVIPHFHTHIFPRTPKDGFKPCA